MALFAYEAVTAGGRLMTGTVEAASHEQADELLKQMQLTVNELGRAEPTRPRTTLGRKAFMLFNQQLAALTEAGIPLERGLRQLADEAASKSMRRLVLSVADRLEAGASIDEAFEQTQGRRFPALYRLILRAGVQSGRLGEMLMSLNRHLAMAGQTRRILFEALCYPLVVLLLAMAIQTGMFAFVIPNFDVIFTDFDIELPGLTKLVLGWSKHPYRPTLVVLGTLGGVAAVLGLLRTFAAGRRFREGFWLGVPILGLLYRCSLLGRLADGMALMVASGADLPTCVRVAAGTTGSEKLKREAEMLAGQLESQANVVEAGRFCRVIGRLFLYSVQLGIQRNELQDNLYGLAEMYRQQVRACQSRLEAFLLPAMIIAVGGMIAVIVMALFMPLVTMIQSLQS